MHGKLRRLGFEILAMWSKLPVPEDLRDGKPVCYLIASRIDCEQLQNMAATVLRRNSTQMTNEERDVRVEDYLNDKLQTYADLENLDTLLEGVKQQQTLLRQQVRPQCSYSKPFRGLTSR